MAKQTGLYHIRGKVGDYKYYGMKGVDGTIMAKQNEGMSERVKTDAAYENTRRNNYEFGMATSTAGSVVKSLSQKWRYLLVPFATAKLAKDAYAFARSKSGEAWGDHALTINDVASIFPALMQKMVKNDISDFTEVAITVTEGETGPNIAVVGDAIANEKAQAAGCDGVRAVLVQHEITPAQGGFTEKQLIPAICATRVLDSADVDFGEDLSLTFALPSDYNAGILSVVLLPYRTIGDENYIMQEFCSAKFAPLA